MGVCGAALGIVALVVGWYERDDRHRKELEHERIASDLRLRIAGVQSFNEGAYTVIGRHLESIQARADISQDSVIGGQLTGLKAELSQLHTIIGQYEAIFWLPLAEGQKSALVTRLQLLERHSVQITCSKDRDCIELARDIRECFVQANWDISRYSTEGGWRSAVSIGFELFGRRSEHAFNQAISTLIAETLRIPIAGVSNFPDADPDYSDIAIVIEPRKIRSD
jgi:hypothetical protein